jgi:hypothetical protein
MNESDRGLLDVVFADGRPLLQLTALSLLFSGCFAVFLAIRREFLPHDLAFLQVTLDELCAIAGCRVVAFMLHDRVAFGGVLIAIAVLYFWLAAVPLKAGAAWAWWTIAASGGTGFLSFLAYLGYGYLDTWHGVGSAFLAPIFAIGLLRTRRLLIEQPFDGWTTVLHALTGRQKLGHVALLATGLGMFSAGGTILVVGATRVFVPQDLEFIGLTVAQLNAFNPRLIPLIAHDRAGFGGGLLSCGSIVMACALFATPSRSLWQALGVAGLSGFGAAVGVHLVVGYTDAMHLAPAIAGSAIFIGALVLTRPTPSCTLTSASGLGAHEPGG